MPISRPDPMKTVSSIDGIVHRWPWLSQNLSRQLVRTYGLPHEATDERLVWLYNDPWARTTLYRDGVYHSFPKPHLDVLEQTLDYLVPINKVRLVESYSASLRVDRGRRQVTVRCANEAMNYLIINLAHEIAVGLLTPDQARLRQREVIGALRLRWPEPMAESLQFTQPAAVYGAPESGESTAPKARVLGPFRKW
ncbi:MAG: hypothetical protein HY006_02785 [Candidatus Sungbacteria bacterium]|nr:hypothetical protein [Candidatus Sungbacteria bacterium]